MIGFVGLDDGGTLVSGRSETPFIIVGFGQDKAFRREDVVLLLDHFAADLRCFCHFS